MIQLGLKQVYSVLDKQHVPRSHLPSLSFSPLRVTKCPELSEGLLQLGRLLQQFKLVSGASAAHGKRNKHSCRGSATPDRESSRRESMTLLIPHDAGHVCLRRSGMGGNVYAQDQPVISYLSFLRLVPLEFGFVKLVLRPLSPLLLGKLICTSLLSLHQYVLNIHLSKSASASGTREGSWDRLTLSISLSRARFCQLHGATVTYAEMNSDGLRLRTNAVMLRTVYVLGDMLSQLIDLFTF